MSWFIFLVFSQLYAKDCAISKNTFLPRPFCSYAMHDIIQRKFLFHSDNNEKDEAFLVSVFTEYMQNFHHNSTKPSSNNLGAMPFWSGTNVLTVGNNNGKADLDAYQLGLGNVDLRADGIAGKIQINPKFQQFGSDILLYYGHTREESGFFFTIDIPLGAVMIDPNLKELEPIIPTQKTYFEQITLPPNSALISYEFQQYPPLYRRPATILDAFCGGDFNADDKLAGNRNQPVRIRKGRIASGKQTVFYAADIAFSLGYNFVINKSGIFGIAAKVACPTGSVPTADYMLEPIFGRGGLWGVGAELTGFYNLWLNESLTKYIDFWWQADILHLTPGRTPNWRSFDLKLNGKGSKYLLIQNYTAGVNNFLFPWTIEPAINLTTLPVFSNIDFESSIACMIDGNYNNWNLACGAEFWVRSAERLSIDFVSAVEWRLPNLNNYAVIGRQVSSYLINGQLNELFTYYCEPLATIGKSQDAVRLVGSPAVNPPGVTVPATLPEGIAQAFLPENRIPARVEDALDIAGAQALRIFSGKVFAQFGYTWSERCFSPSLSFVGGLELSSEADRNLSLWSLGLQWSLVF